jgi:hypothetical protein
MKEQTAVEWLVEQLQEQNGTYRGFVNIAITHQQLIEHAKEMEKNQIIKAFTRGYLIGEDESFPIEAAHKAGQKYYDEIIKTK